MDRPAKAKDILDLRTGRHASGHLVHTGCGGVLKWSLFTDGASCVMCGLRWEYGYLLDRDNPKGKPELYKWEPPVEVRDATVPRS